MSSILGGFGVSSGSIGRASVDLVLNSGAYSAEMAAVKGETAAASGSLQQGMTKALSSIKSALGGVGTAAVAVGALAVIGITKAIGVTQQWAAEVRTLQRVTGESAEATSGLLAAGELLNLDVAKLNTGFGVFAKNITTNNAALEEYGVTTKDADGNTLSFTDVLKNAQDKFQTLAPGIEQTGFAMRIFGRSGKEMIPILGKTSEEMQELIDKGAEAGLIMSQDDLNASKELSIAQRELGHAIKGAAVTIGKTFVPAATVLVKAIVSIATKVIQLMAPAFDAAKQALGNLGKALSDFYKSLGPAGPMLLKFIGFLAAGPLLVFVAALQVTAFVINLVAKGFELAAQYIGPVFAAAINVGVTAINILIAAYNKVIDVSNSLLGTHFEHIDALEGVGSASGDAADGMDDAADSAEDLAGAEGLAARETRTHTAALKEQRLALLQSAGGTLGLIASLQQVAADERTLQRLRENGKRGTQAYSDAVIAATTDNLAFRTELRQQAKTMHDNGDSIGNIRNVLKEMARQAGVSGEDFRRALGGPLDEVLGKLDKLKSIRTKLNVDTSDIDYASDKLQALINLSSSRRY